MQSIPVPTQSPCTNRLNAKANTTVSRGCSENPQLSGSALRDELLRTGSVISDEMGYLTRAVC